MTGVVETVSIISETMDKLIDFVVSDETLSKDFENFLSVNKIQINKESELNDILIDYLLSGKMENGLFVLDYYQKKVQNCDKNILEALKKSFISVFKINKITKNAFTTEELSSKKEFCLIPLVKTTSLRGIGLYDFIKARVIELFNNFYLLEIHDTYGQYREFEANLECVKAIIKDPKIAVLYSKEKLFEIKKITESFYSSFIECFNKNEIIVSNKDADRILDEFYSFHLGKTDKVDFKELTEKFDYKFFEIDEYSGNLLLNTALGFGAGDVEYDVGFYFDKTFGLFIIPFLGTFNKILSSDKEVENDDLCVKEMLLSDRVSPNLLIEYAEKYPNFVEIINKYSCKNFNSVSEIINSYKYDYQDGLRFSPVMVLYGSEVFEKVLGHKAEKENKTVGRNDLCPCGSGIKYKKCCLKKLGE